MTLETKTHTQKKTPVQSNAACDRNTETNILNVTSALIGLHELV